ncbi:hypothetical protein EDC94DRAFT_608346 [Helicostylum pulchrum]|uniref:Uncharacterized protein n=1 Tax=Helicostylum pulchrum TaxID=562976 RepID=A0ABP9XWW6_9FUNG|nr:hypothetical protein EDC94DRAFT_608346 [Helicostylum pulchrum]
MSKRANQDPITPENKRTRSEAHAADCTDKTCQGCDVGEVEFSFVRKDAQGQPIDTEPNAQELLAMAIEEASSDNNNDNDDENNGIARRLFDMAIAKFQKDEPENRMGYATCLVELGKAISVQESISEGLEILRGELKKNNTEQVALKLAGAAISLATSIRKEQDAYFEKQQQEIDEDDEVALGELLEKQEVTKQEIKLYKEALEHTRDAFSRLGNDEALLKEAQSVLFELRSYGLLLVQPFHKDHANTVLDTVLELVQKLPEYENNDELLLLWAACLLHQEKFVDDEKKKLAMYSKIDELLAKSNALYLIKNDKENHYVWEMYAMLRINQSNSAEDEDDALELYDEAIEAFKKAHALDPDNEKLAGMVAMFSALQDQENEEDDDEEEEEEEDEE